jgi:hypothetical protein
MSHIYALVTVTLFDSDHIQFDSLDSDSMLAKTALCTCQKFCQAPPEGKAIPIRTWYSHAAQRCLEEQMTQEQCDTQKSRIRRAKRPRVQV